MRQNYNGIYSTLLPVQEQYSYVFGIVWKHFREKGYDTWVLSRNYLNNTQNKYQNNIEADSNKVLDYLSGEGEIKARYERTIIGEKGFRLSYGVGYEYGHYRNSTYRRIYSGSPIDTEIDYESNLKIGKFSGFGQVSRSFIGSKAWSLIRASCRCKYLFIRNAESSSSAFAHDFQHPMH